MAHFDCGTQVIKPGFRIWQSGTAWLLSVLYNSFKSRHKTSNARPVGKRKDEIDLGGIWAQDKKTNELPFSILLGVFSSSANSKLLFLFPFVYVFSICFIVITVTYHMDAMYFCQCWHLMPSGIADDRHLCLWCFDVNFKYSSFK